LIIRVYDLEVGVDGLVFGKYMIKSLGCIIQNSGFMVKGLGFTVQGLGIFLFIGSRFRIQG